MTLTEVKNFTVQVLKKYFTNKSILDKFGEDDNKNLTYDGNKIDGNVSISELSTNAIKEKSDGLYVEDKTNAIKTLNNNLKTTNDHVDLVEYKADRLNIAQETKNTDLGYLTCSFETSSLTMVTNESYGKTYELQNVKIGDVILFDKFIGDGIEIDDANHSIKLKGGRTYNFILSHYADGFSAKLALYALYNLTDNTYYDSFLQISNDIGHTNANSMIVHADKDIEVCLKLISCDNGTSNDKINIYCKWYDSAHDTEFDILHLDVMEIGRQIVVDPIEYVQDTNPTEDTPIGHIISYMGTVAPKNYLMCDGTIYNIDDYKELAQFIKENFGTYNYFGGDGDLTFAVPDLRGEFLRGSGTATRDTGSGGELGEHQDSTLVGSLYTNAPQGGNAVQLLLRDNLLVENYDKSIAIDSSHSVVLTGSARTQPSSTHTIRPTNTAVNYCIKCKHTYAQVFYGMETVTELMNEEKVSVQGSTANVVVELNDSIKNYDKIEFVYSVHRVNEDDDVLTLYQTVRTKDIKIFENDVIDFSTVKGEEYYVLYSGFSDNLWLVFLNNGSKINFYSVNILDHSVNGFTIRNVRGIKNHVYSNVNSGNYIELSEEDMNEIINNATQ